MTRRWSGIESGRPQVQDAPKRGQRGFAYLLALFMILGVIIASQIAVKNIATEGRREREADMIWRGEQYTRAIRLYYRKAGHYPQDLDDLEKGLPDLHFLRYAATKDPMNAADGAWGYIYVNAAGQLIGSSKYASLQQMALIDLNGGQLPTTTIAGATPVSSMGSQTTGPNLPPADSSTQAQGTSSPTSPTGGSSLFGPSPSSTSPPLAGSPSTGLFGASNPIASQKPTGPVDGPVLGAFLTGVVSKSARPSVKVYNGGKKYSEWEFIWNPLEDQARATQQGLAPQGAVPGQPGQPAGATGAPAGASGIISSLFGGAAAPGASQQGSTPSGSPAPQQSQPTQ